MFFENQHGDRTLLADAEQESPIARTVSGDPPVLRRPVDYFEPPGAVEPTGCGATEPGGVWDRCASGIGNGECDAIRPNIEAGQHDGPFDDLYDRMDSFLRLHYFTVIPALLFRRSFALIMENHDILNWIVCCKATNVAFSDGTYRNFADRLAKLARGRLDTIEVFYLHAGDKVPDIDALADLGESGSRLLLTHWIAAGWAGEVTPWYSDADPSSPWASYRRILLINGESATFKALVDAWSRRRDSGDQRCIELMFASVIVHELVHCLGVPHLATEFYSDPDLPDGCFVHDRIQGGWLWAMLKRYPDANDSACCASYQVGATVYDDQGDLVTTSDVRC